MVYVVLFTSFFTSLWEITQCVFIVIQPHAFLCNLFRNHIKSPLTHAQLRCNEPRAQRQQTSIHTVYNKFIC